MPQMIVDERYTHQAQDASGSRFLELAIQPDRNGLSIELPNGNCVIIDCDKDHVEIAFSESPDDDADSLKVVPV